MSPSLIKTHTTNLPAYAGGLPYDHEHNLPSDDAACMHARRCPRASDQHAVRTYVHLRFGRAMHGRLRFVRRLYLAHFLRTYVRTCEAVSADLPADPRFGGGGGGGFSLQNFTFDP
jgi:hypothetical protein